MLKVELLTLQAETKTQDTLEKLVNARLNLGTATYTSRGTRGVTVIESASDLPNAAWTKEVVRLACIITARTTKELTDARLQMRTSISKSLANYPTYITALQEIATMIDRTGLSASRAQAFKDAMQASPCK